MIKLERIRTTQAITAGLRGDKLVEKNLEVLKLKRDLVDIPSKKFKSSKWKPAKKQLRKESHDKCAYCEADTKVVAHGDVEHFRPKNVYWWLAYCYDNYLYSCQICNQSFKSNQFPVSGTKLPAPRVTRRTSDARLAELARTLTHDPLETTSSPTLASFEAEVARENADPIDPYFQDPEDLLVYRVDDDNAEVTVHIKPRTRGRAAKQAAVDDVYGLNREELRKVRYQDYRKALILGKTFGALQDHPDLRGEVESALTDMMADGHRFAGMNRFFVRTVWRLDL